MVDNNITFSPYCKRLLSSHQYQGRNNDCGPYVISTILQSLIHNQIKGIDVANEMNGIRWKNFMPQFYRIPNWITFPWGIKQYIKSKGIDTQLHLFSNLDSLITYITQDIITIVLIGEYYPLWAHYLIFGAYSGNQGFGFIDPGIDQKLLRWIDLKKFKKYWKHYLNTIITIKPDTRNV